MASSRRRSSDSAGARPARERLLRWRILGPSIEEQVAEEIDLHVELLARELEAEGMSASRARAEAALRFRDRTRVAADCVRLARGTERRWRWRVFLGELAQDVRYGLRQLGRAPSFAAVALLTLALGIGATTAIFSVVDGVVLHRFPFAHPERVMLVHEEWQGSGSSFSVGNFIDVRGATHAFSALAAERFRALNLADGDRPERVLTAQVTRGFFDVFGIQPRLGRTFLAEEDATGRDQEAVLSHHLWQEHFAGDPAILQRILHLSGRTYRVVGVMPASFDPTLDHEDLWLPMAFTPAETAEHDDHFLEVVGLLRPGVSAGAATQDLGAVVRRLAALYPDANIGRTGARIESLADYLVGSYRQKLFVLLGAVGLVLLIACANVASLLLARGTARARELAIRNAVGAGGRRIVRQLLAESLVLAWGGGALGLALAAAAVRLFTRWAPAAIPRAGDTHIDGTVLAFALAVSTAASVLCGLAPALRAARQDPQTLLRGGASAGARAGIGPARDRMRSLLVTAELALALTLLAGAGLLIRSSLYLERTPTGFDAGHLTLGRLSLPEAVYPRATVVEQTFEGLTERLARQPGVRDAAAVTGVPLGPGGGSNGLLPEGRPLTPENLIEADLHVVTPAYFSTLRIPLVAGRPFTPSDSGGSPLVMVVSRALARRAWGDADPIGRRIACCDGGPRTPPSLKTVVGVVGDVHTRGPAKAVRPEFYLPIAQAPAPAWTWVQRTMTLVARGDDPRLLAGALRAAVHEVAPALPVTLTTMDEARRGTMAEQRFHTVLLLALGILGLVLAAVGTYGVISYLAALRTQEVGIRMALGAHRRDILLLVARHGAPPVAAGLAAGAAGALLAARWLRSSLYGVTPSDPWTLACVLLLLAATAALAILIPALGATRIDPKQAIQEA